MNFSREIARKFAALFLAEFLGTAFLLAAVVGSEAIATFGLLLTIFGCVARAPAVTPFAVGLYIVAAYWFTASTSFANPAVTLARAFTDTFSGIAPQNVGAFIAAQTAGALIALAVAPLLRPREQTAEKLSR